MEKNENTRALLAGLNCGSLADFDNSDEDTLDELEQLLITAGGECVLRTLQNRRAPDPGTFLGQGKLSELASLVKENEINLAVFDNEITPSQNRALEEKLGCRVIDRSALILDIFASRANTREGKLQVELAQYKYLLPRLTGMWGHLVRQTASSSPIGTRGPGETQLETDRRHIRRKIQKLEEEIEDVRRIRQIQRSKRVKSRIPLICLVGYTNAGKSTLLNALTGAGVHAANRLFDTLDPTTKLMQTEDMGELLISDTVGFIRKLPHHLIDAFRATLEELTFADVLVHVIDASDPQFAMQTEIVEKLIDDLGATGTPQVRAYNKADLLSEDELPRARGAVCISAKTGENVDALLGAIKDALGKAEREVSFILPYEDGRVLDMLYRDAHVLSAGYGDAGIAVKARCDGETYGK
ncbi:MAG: GTPase HflX, partial [Clostridia bacterium]|nr:GTPase HflX [Clostridia bacterium]